MTVIRRPWALAGLVAAGVLLLDQVVKAMVRAQIQTGERRRVTSFLDLVHVRNDGVAFGQLSGGGVLVGFVVAVALGALIYYFVTHIDLPWIWLPTGLLLGGAIGNIVDRVRLGAVTDFLKFAHWPAFNVADSAITVGVVILLLVIERAPDRDSN